MLAGADLLIGIDDTDNLRSPEPGAAPGRCFASWPRQVWGRPPGYPASAPLGRPNPLHHTQFQRLPGLAKP
ncbi:hypothetical protein I552_3210 [Mycobacterium xenopi 3993]|nr:hypothetical protein I552_3210 [Mycobacterium xenopi 3993]